LLGGWWGWVLGQRVISFIAERKVGIDRKAQARD